MATERPDKGFDDGFWGEALEGADLSKLGKGKEEEYPTASPREISEAFEHYPLRGELMRMGNDITRNARAQAEGTKPRDKRYHEAGWELAIETPRGVVGLWSCWLKNQFHLGYPKDILPSNHPETDELIMRTLRVERAVPVKQVDAVAVNDWNYEGQYKDADKPLERNELGQILALRDRGPRLWARFYGPLEASGGRIWVDSSDFSSNAYHIKYLKDGQLDKAHFGHKQSRNVYTFPFSEYSKYAPDGPTANAEVVQKYKDRFIHLAAEVAFVMGGVNAVNITYGLDDKGIALVPEDLYREGYEGIKWHKGDLGERKGWGNELVSARKGDSTVILESGNSIVPWLTTLHAPASRLTSPALLAGFIKEDILWF